MGKKRSGDKKVVAKGSSGAYKKVPKAKAKSPTVARRERKKELKKSIVKTRNAKKKERQRKRKQDAQKKQKDRNVVDYEKPSVEPGDVQFTRRERTCESKPEKKGPREVGEDFDIEKAVKKAKSILNKKKYETPLTKLGAIKQRRMKRQAGKRQAAEERKEGVFLAKLHLKAQKKEKREAKKAKKAQAEKEKPQGTKVPEEKGKGSAPEAPKSGGDKVIKLGVEKKVEKNAKKQQPKKQKK